MLSYAALMIQEDVEITMITDFKSQKVSVLVPCYNVEDTLDRCIDSIEAQTHKNIEIVAVNDGSTDGTGRRLKERSVSSPLPFRLIEKENTGYGDSMNRAMDAARGDWIAIVEPDDWIDQDMYDSMLSFADDVMRRSHTEYAPDIIKTPYWREVKGERLRCGYKGLVRLSHQPFLVQDNPAVISGHPSIWSALYKRDYLVNHNIRFKPIPGAGWSDNPFMISAMCRNFPMVYLDKEFYHYTDTAEDDYRKIMSSTPSMPFDRWNDMMDTIKAIDGDDKVGKWMIPEHASIYRSIIRRGFTYLAIAEENKPEDGNADDVIAKEAEKMFKRIPSDYVKTDARLSASQKERYAKTLGINIDVSASDNMRHFMYLAYRGIASIKANGIMNTIGQISKVRR